MPPTAPRKLAVLPGASVLALCGVGPTSADRFTQMHPLYREIAAPARLRRATPALLAWVCPQAASAPGSVALALPTFGYAVCAATRDT